MVVQTTHVSAEEFERFAALPENAERLFELVGGEIVEVVSNSESSELGALMIFFVSSFVRPRGLGRVTGADGGYVISGERYMPDCAFVSKQKQPNRSRVAYNPIPPDLAVEVLSPSNTPAEMRIKIVNYLHAGVLVWVVDPDLQRVEVYAPDQPPRILGLSDTLDGGAVLPGFTLAVKELFSE